MSSILALGLLVLLQNPSGSREPALHWKPVRAGQACAATAPSQSVLRTQSAFDSYWAQNFGSATQPTGIDWGKVELVAIHLGYRGSRNYAVGISSVKEVDGEVVVGWFERTPSAKSAQQPKASSPYVVVSIPASIEPVVFRSHVQDPDNPFSDGNAFPVRKFLSGAHSFVKGESNTVLNEPSDVAELWRTAFGPATAPPKTDFQSWRYVAIFLGQRPTPGYEIVIQRIARIGPKEVQVIYAETKPAKDAIEPQMVTNPFVILEIPRTDDEVTIQRGN